ncbi:MAG: type IV secretory system conjugative DNA transfer family protein [Candidatus Dormibacteraceae bacterium]
MSQQQSSSTASSTLSITEMIIFGGILAFWVIGGLMLAVAAVLAGGHPNNPFGWPVLAVGNMFSGQELRPWEWVGASYITSPLFFWGLVIAQIALSGVPAILTYGKWRGVLPNTITSHKTPNASGWGKAWDKQIRKLIVTKIGEAGRVILGWRGRLLLATEPGASMLIFGPTQSGKTAGICIPAILEWTGPILSISIKRDLVDTTAGYRQRKGKVLIYDPSGVTDLPCMKFSPHFFCQDFETAWKIGNWLSGVIDRGKSRGDSDWGHWRDAAHRLLAVAFYAGANLGAPMSEVRSWIDDGSGESLRHALSLIPDCDQTAIEVYQSVQQRPERERGSCYSTTQRIVSVFMERKVAASAESNEFNPRDFLLDGENTLYLVAPLEDQDRLAILFVAVIQILLDTTAEIAQSSPSGKIPQRLLLVMDELANTAPIEKLPNYLSTGFSQGISVIAVFQDMAQIRDRYQERTETIINNSRAKLFLSGIGDMQTLETAEKLVGEEKYKEKKWSIDHQGHRSNNYSIERRRMAPAYIVRELAPMTGLLLYHYLKPQMLGLRPWFKNRILQQKAAIPFIPGAMRVVA